MENKITYTKQGDYLLPDLKLPETKPVSFGRYGRMRQKYLKNHRNTLYTSMLNSGSLYAHLEEIDRTANWALQNLMKQMANEQCINEELKARDQLAWVGAMNNIRSCAEEAILTEVVFA